MTASYGSPGSTSVPEKCSRCDVPCGITRYYIQDFREGFIVHHVYCSERCAKRDLDGDEALAKLEGIP